MTSQQLNRVKFAEVTHLNCGDWHYTTYESRGITPKISICVHTHFDVDSAPDDCGWVTEEKHYSVNGEVYDTKRKFLKAIKNIEFQTA